jgi:peptidyl-prolyl cis-trans isomerase D
MMEAMRNAAKGWVAKVLLVLLAISFGIFFNISDVVRHFGSTWLATIGDQEIQPQEFQRAYSDYLRNYSRQTGQALSPEDARKFGLDRALLNDMIRSAVIDNGAATLKLAISDEYLAAEARDNPAFRGATGQFDVNTFRLRLQNAGLTEEGFFQRERSAMLSEALTGTASSDIPLSKTLLEAQYNHANEQRDVRYFVVTTAESEVTAPTDAEIQKEYVANPPAYTAPEYRSIAVMKVEPADITGKITLTDTDLAEAYERHKAEYFTPEKRTVMQLSFPSLEEAKAAKAKLDAGTDFAALVKERGVTEAEITFADKVKTEFLDKAIADAVFGVAEGKVSDPIKGALATVLLKVTKVTPEHQGTLDEVKAQLTDRVKLERARDEISTVYAAVEDSLAAGSKSFEDIAKETGATFLLAPAVDAAGKNKDGKDVSLPHPRDVTPNAFASDMGVQNPALSVEDGYIWYEVRAVVPSAVQPLAEVKDKARAAVLAAKLRDKSEEKAKALIAKAKSGTSLDDLAKEAGTTVQLAQGLKRTETTEGFTTAAVKAVFAVPENGFAFALEADGKGARVMQSQAVLLPAFDPNAADVKPLTDRLSAELGRDLSNALVTAMQNDTGVTVNETLWRQISGQQTQ